MASNHGWLAARDRAAKHFAGLIANPLPLSTRGSTTERVVRHAACPVLTVRSHAEAKSSSTKSRSLAPSINRILVPVDFSAPSREMLKFAVAFALNSVPRWCCCT
ncbi:MAG: universal stress protein [Verrucomicrobia bacterium]|nr:universal stress protein [Verrucomicrobiota bacterium]